MAKAWGGAGSSLESALGPHRTDTVSWGTLLDPQEEPWKDAVNRMDLFMLTSEATEVGWLP